LIPTGFEDLLPQGYTVMPTIMPPVIASLLPLPRRAPRRDKSLIQELHTDFCARSSPTGRRKTSIACGVIKTQKKRAKRLLKNRLAHSP
jgi:hypothetical protein